MAQSAKAISQPYFGPSLKSISAKFARYLLAASHPNMHFALNGAAQVVDLEHTLLATFHIQQTFVAAASFALNTAEQR